MYTSAMISEIINKELEGWIEKIRKNLENSKSGRRTNASCRASKSLRVVEDGNRFSIMAVDYFTHTERGYDGKNPPAPIDFAEKLFQWSKDKQIAFESDDMRMSFATLLAKRIKKRGTLLYQEGGTTEIYTDVIDEGLPILERKVKDGFSKQIKILLDERNSTN